MPNKWLFCKKNTVIADGIERKETEECLLTQSLTKLISKHGVDYTQ